nr:hypothetical protein BaRGS_011956 [Batillaria attramentaria]
MEGWEREETKIGQLVLQFGEDLLETLQKAAEAGDREGEDLEEGVTEDRRKKEAKIGEGTLQEKPEVAGNGEEKGEHLM